MTIEQINEIGESEFLKYDLQKTKQVVEALERIKWQPNDLNLEENASFYNWLMDIAEDKIINNDFPELNEDQKTLLLIRILRIQTRISEYKLSFVQKVAERNFFRLRDDSINSVREYIHDSVNSFETNLQTKTTDAINEIEPQIMSTILSVMGVFSAIITIVMSVVITSASWLNNANGASAIIAFIVPSLVAVTSMAVLLFIVFSRKKENIIVIPGRDWESPNVIEKKIKCSKRYALISVLALVLCLLGLFFISAREVKNSVEPHVRYILKEDMYEIVTYEFENSDKVEIKIEFEFDGKSLSILYDEKYFHDGNLYFCSEHNQLE